MIAGQVKGVGVLAPEARMDPEQYSSEVVRETGMILHEREEVIRTGCYAATQAFTDSTTCSDG